MNQSENSKNRYRQLVNEKSPNSKLLGNCIRAFVVGGLICVLGQLIFMFLQSHQIPHEEARMYTAYVLIAAAILLTGFGWYDKIGEHAGAGSFVPITGFANAIAAPAIEHKKEGLVLGVGAKMFIIAGPVILYGTLTSIVVGLVYYFVQK